MRGKKAPKKVDEDSDDVEEADVDEGIENDVDDFDDAEDDDLAEL